MTIDVHAHCIPDTFRAWLVDNGDRVGATVVESGDGECVQFRDGPRTGAQFSWRSLSDMDARLDSMDQMGIDVQVLAGWIDLAGYEVPTGSALEYARAHNEALATAAASDPNRFRAIGTAPLQSPELAVTALEHAMDDLGMVGLQVATRIGGDHIGDNETLDEFWHAAEENGALLVLHPVRPLEGVDLGRYFLDNTVGRPAESTVALSGLIMAGVFERHPRLRVCVVHGGGFLPYQVGRLDRAFARAPQFASGQISRPPSSFLDQVYVDTIVHDATALRFVIDRLGADHVVMGSDYPFPMGDDDPLRLLDSVKGLTDEERCSIVGDNISSWIG